MPTGGRTTYRALPPLKSQLKFPNRRKSVKSKVPSSRLTKSQSTLTQLEFIRPPGGGSASLPISSDSDQEYEESRPKKKRRTFNFGGKDPDQSTMTQFERGDVPSSLRKSKSETDADKFHIWEDCDPEQFGEDVKGKQTQRARKLPRLRTEDTDGENDRVIFEIPETSQIVPVSSPKDSGIEMESKISPKQDQTPRQVRFTEIASSQTPPSTKHSPPGSMHRILRSPLKEKSTNSQTVGAVRHSSDSQMTDMKRLERVRFAKRKISLPQPEEVERPKTEIPLDLQSIENNQASPGRETTPRLERITTIPDSQSDGSASILAADSFVQPRRKIQRTTTIQDSQYEDLDLEGDDLGNVHDYDSQIASQYGTLNTQATFDPVFSALDRDASRFGWTQTQRLLSPIAESGIGSESEGDDLDRGATTPPRRRGRSSDDLSQNVDHSSSPPQKPEDAIKSPNASQQLLHDHVAAASNNSKISDINVPSSPPLFHSSQVSTVVPTQASLSRPSPSLPATMEFLPEQSIQLLPLSSSPLKLSWELPESSSPLQRPPWSSPERACHATVDSLNGDGETIGSEADLRPQNLPDFSLPPPPFLSSSSRRGTPASSGV